MTDATATILNQLLASREERKALHAEAAARWEEVSRHYRDYFNHPTDHPTVGETADRQTD